VQNLPRPDTNRATGTPDNHGGSTAEDWGDKPSSG
jgi:hypothetical protein